MIAAVLAGGRGSRMGAPKAVAPLGGRSMIEFPLAALAEVCERVAVTCKRDTELPELPAGVERWEEPDEPRHPAVGIAYALERAGDEVLVCPTDMPLLESEAVEALTAEAEGLPGFAAVIALMDGRAVPVLGVYRLEARTALLRAADEGHAMQALALDLRAAVVELPPSPSVDSPEDLAAAEARLRP